MRWNAKAAWVVLAVVVFWAGNVLIDAAQLRLDVDYDPLKAHWPHFFTKRGLLSLYWVVLTLGALAWYDSHPVPFGQRAALGRALLLALGITLVASLGYVAYLGLVLSLVTPKYTWGSGMAVAWPGDAIYFFVTSWQVLVAVNAALTFRRAQRHQRDRDELLLKLKETELSLLRTQLEPHFFFNTLNSIAALVRLQRSEAAIEALHQLSVLLRRVLEVGHRQLMPWHWEHEFTVTYLGLQKLRFGELLEVSLETDGMNADLSMPIMLLQPLLENAIVHGPLGEGQRCQVSVCCAQVGARLQLEVSNSVAKAASPLTHHGLGLRTIGSRLAVLYADDFHFTHQREGDRFVVRVDLPARPCEATA
jgi:Histidine kinase